MSVKGDVAKVNKSILTTYEKRAVQVFALANFFAAEAINYFRNAQLAKVNGQFWVNQTYVAAQRFFTRAFRQTNEIGFKVAHGIDYGVYLELANHGQNAAIKPILNIFSRKFIRAARKLYEPSLF
jgi:hypothetical protein